MVEIPFFPHFSFLFLFCFQEIMEVFQVFFFLLLLLSSFLLLLTYITHDCTFVNSSVDRGL